MNERSVAHETIVLRRTYNVSIDKLFAAFEDVNARAEWSAPSDKTAIKFEKTDFRVGGLDVSRCGAKDEPQYPVEVRYLDIIRGYRIVFSETVDHAGSRLSASLVTVNISRAGSQSELILTVQIASFDGADMAAGNKAGYGAALENLASYLLQRPDSLSASEAN
jgi:uncharacterized protein YndB with AHSA1/START domain